ncbi:MAG: transcriptional regulator [Thermoanaerobaculia bacterium]|nr:MAG: transcriptional regulator [Thermoanaerobaculia bacterium]
MTEFLNTRRAADYLAGLGIELSTKTLEGWRTAGTGPRFVKLGGKKGKVLYRVADLLAFLESSLRTSTRDKGRASERRKAA